MASLDLCARFHGAQYLPLKSGKNYFLTYHVFLFFYAIRYYIRDLMIILYKIVHKIYSLRLFMNKLL